MKGREANANLDKNNLPAKIQLKHEQRIFPSIMANSAQNHCRTFEQHFSFLCYNALVELMNYDHFCTAAVWGGEEEELRNRGSGGILRSGELMWQIRDGWRD